jgi:hypothetical protein
MKLDVGSIIYIIDPKKRSVLPARVNEQLVSKTLQGEKITHNIEFSNGKITTLESHDVAFFSSLDKVSAYLLERAKEMITLSVEGAAKTAEEKFGTSQDLLPVKPNSEEIIGSITNEAQEREMSVTLDSGQKLKIHMPDGF